VYARGLVQTLFSEPIFTSILLLDVPCSLIG
jgi:hypothetical protein